MITVDFQILKDCQSGRMLDIGCGSGRHTAAAYDRDHAFVVGADYNFSDLLQARERMYFHEQMSNPKHGCWHLCAADVTRLPFKDGSFDVIICSEVLEHVSLHIQAVSELLRLLKTKGVLAISVPRRWPEILMWAISKAYQASAGGHIRIYQKKQLIKLVEKSGAQHRYSHYAHSLHTPFWLLKCLLGLEKEHLWPVNLYHRFLTWDLMQKPRITRLLERSLNPILGKSLVLYFTKN
jgi:ubiquinone/menaquinone biosynthesis C-methylase UbiE